MDQQNLRFTRHVLPVVAGTTVRFKNSDAVEHNVFTPYSYHSCQNRHCPKCQNDQAQQWVTKQTELLVDVRYFLVTFTLPKELRQLARANQRTAYDILFATSSAALQKLAEDPTYIGGRLGFVGVLHTWTRDLRYHPHVHYLVPGGGLSPQGRSWRFSQKKFLLPVKALSKIFRAKFRDALAAAGLFDQVPSSVWQKDWVVHSKPAGRGREVLRYFAPYIYRVAITNRRLLGLEDNQVSFRYKDHATKKWRLTTVSAEEFIRRFLQHVLPRGFQKVRYYGWLHPRQRNILLTLQLLLGRASATANDPLQRPKTLNHLCPKCGKAMRLIEEIPPHRRAPPQAQL